MESTPTLYNFALLLMGVGFGCLHRWHVSTLFENDRHFSHLSEIEREMSFRTEMGMYYSYFKTIIESENIFEGLEKIRKDNISEYGHVINAARKYGLFPEIIAGHLYYLAQKLGLLSKEECWEIDRGCNLPPVTSCEGLGVPMYFYLEIAWFAAEATVLLLFLYSTYLSNSVFGGLLTVLAFFYNHNECTRVQWTPSLRETFGYPLLLYQMFTVTMAIRIYSRTEVNKVQPLIDPLIGLLGIIHCTTFMSLITWQFSCFVLITQIIALLLLKWLRLIPDALFDRLILIHATAIGLGILMGDASRLISSLYTCLVLGCIFIKKFMNRISLSSGIYKTIIEIGLIIMFTKFLKTYILTSEEYAHVFDILKSKLTNYRDFHTMLYTCSPEFDFLQYRTFEVIVSTLLLPIAVFAGILALYYWYRNYRTLEYPKCIEAEVVYNGLQTGAFIIMAVFVMRLKLLMTPHLCIMAGTMCSKKYMDKIGLKSNKFRCSLIVLVIALMSYPGMSRVREERSIIGEYGNIEQEELFEWIKQHTPKSAVFAGKMSLMANVMLSTRRAIVNNPYYESKEMRDRTMKVYEIFSRKDAVSVYSTLKSMKVDYVILEKPLCFGLANSPTGCQMIDLWDLVDNGAAKMVGKPALCPLLFYGNSYPFRKVFQNDYYVLLQLDYSHYIELKPKTAVSLDYQA